VDEAANDPGWPSIGAVARTLWTVVMPGARVRLYQHQLAAGRNGLTLLRVVYVQCVVMSLAVGVVIVVMDARGTVSHATTAIWTAVVLAVGAACVVLPRRLDPPLACTSDAALATTYTNRFFIRVTVAQAPTLVGFVAALVAQSVLVGCVAVGFSIVAYVLAAPTRRQLATDQRDLDASGCHRALLPAVVRGGRPAAGH